MSARMLRVGSIVFVFLAGIFSVRAADDAVAAQLAQMQQQMKAMAAKIESQQVKIEEQDKTIKALKGGTTTIGTSPAAQAMNESAPRPQPQAEPSRLDGRLPSYEMPPVTVTDTRTSSLREEDLIGSYKQPRWTARRRFTETRAYVIPEGNFEFEYWNIVKVPRDGSDTTVETKYEVEIGLPNRFQLDLYAISHSEGNQKSFGFDEQDVELRWAWADWGVIPGNPTLYAEYKFLNEEADHVEFKLLTAGETPVKGLHWAANAVWEHAMGDAQTNSYELTSGLSYTIKDEKLSVGLEAKLAFEDEKDNRGLHKPEFLLGPSIQFSPLKQMHIDFSPLVGFTEQSPALKSLLIVGWEF